MRIGKSSSLPASISRISTTFDIGEKKPKFEVGPTCSSPGPILLRQEETAVKLVTEGTFSIARTIAERAKTAI